MGAVSGCVRYIRRGGKSTEPALGWIIPSFNSTSTATIRLYSTPACVPLELSRNSTHPWWAWPRAPAVQRWWGGAAAPKGTGAALPGRGAAVPRCHAPVPSNAAHPPPACEYGEVRRPWGGCSASRKEEQRLSAVAQGSGGSSTAGYARTLRTELVSPADCGRKDSASVPLPPSPLMT